ncbi:MAG: hypothetical protein JW947_08435 [Sedimentisphaerales bacterium]|nr:hypothetical protein [Sedimentisphaerales bacterium]
MYETIAIIIACFSLVVSGVTMWFTLFHKGEVKMTQPTMIAFVPTDGGKIFFRTLLYSTGKRGRVVQNMYVEVQNSKSLTVFGIWVYGDKQIVRGSGIYVGPEGVACNHHFLVPRNGKTYEFLPGEYVLKIYASLVNRCSPLLLYHLKIFLSNEEAIAIKSKDAGVWFEWDPYSAKYYSHIDSKPELQDINIL